jgi:hypothetical protein
MYRKTKNRMSLKFLRTLPWLAIVAAAAPAPAAAAGFVNNRDGWMALQPQARMAYVQGLNDSLNFVFVDDTLVDALVKRARTRCLIDQKTTAAILSDRITMAYRDERNAGFAPTAIYILKMAEVCRSYVNEERQGFGLGPQ